GRVQVGGYSSSKHHIVVGRTGRRFRRGSRRRGRGRLQILVRVRFGDGEKRLAAAPAADFLAEQVLGQVSPRMAVRTYNPCHRGALKRKAMGRTAIPSIQ